MKKEDVEIIGKTIVLGVFDTVTFRYFVIQRRAISYSRFEDWSAYEESLFTKVEIACEMADKIIFVLDDVHFPIDPQESITCMELKIVCDNKDFFNKTVFVKGDNIIDFDKNLVI